MHVSWGDILVCLFMHLRLVLLISLILFIVIFGRLLLLAFQDLNIIWSYLMIALIICGLFPYALSLTLSVRCLTSSPMPLPSLAPPSKKFSATMARSSTTPVPARSSSLELQYLLGCGAPAYWPGCRGLCDRLICIRQGSWLIGCVL